MSNLPDDVTDGMIDAIFGDSHKDACEVCGVEYDPLVDGSTYFLCATCETNRAVVAAEKRQNEGA